MRLNLRNLIDDAKCFETVRRMRRPEGPRCPHCDAETITRQGRDETQPERRRYRCEACRRKFDDLTGTVFAGHRQPLATWMLCLYLMGLSLSNEQIAGELGLNKDDARDDRLFALGRGGAQGAAPAGGQGGMRRSLCGGGT